jgi:hypothetical protein
MTPSSRAALAMLRVRSSLPDTARRSIHSRTSETDG